MNSRIAIVAVLIVLIGWVLGLGCYPMIMWSPLNCSHEDIDINTGRIRYQRFLAGVCVSERIADSPISRELGMANVRPDWRRVNTFSPCVRHSPHYRFHAAISQTRLLEILWDLAAFTPDARKVASQEVLRLWQTGQDYWAADEYIHTLETLVMDRDSDAPPIRVADLPGS